MTLKNEDGKRDFEFIDSIQFKKNNVIRENPGRLADYSPYFTNVGLSYFPDTILYVNIMNTNSELPPLAQYEFLLNTIRPKRRYSKWFKKKRDEKIYEVMELLDCNYRRAREALTILSDADIDKLREEKDIGGTK